MVCKGLWIICLLPYKWHEIVSLPPGAGDEGEVVYTCKVDPQLSSVWKYAILLLDKTA